MTEIVLDASALLAVFNNEAGADRVIAVLPVAVISAVNLAEVVTKLQERGMPDDRIRANIAALELSVDPFGEAMAIETGLLRTTTHAAGLSLGDRACLALAHARRAPAFTADRSWTTLDMSADIELIR